ncbi:MAG: hypothetical protein JST66_03030 [Bacteroidetes bacterium]|nr:hypothetical protein [Bacteroidota bacterium]
MTRAFPALLLSALTGLAQAQPTDTRALVAADLEAVNGHFHGIAGFTIDREERLVVDLYDGGARYRQDVVYVEFLDPAAFAFSPEENVVMLKCTDEHGRCIDKELFKLNTISHTGRMNLPVPAGDPGGTQALALLGKLVRDKQMALRAPSAETDRRRSRSN